MYAQHAHPVLCARFSPSGYYCASGDAAGNVRVWDVLGPTSASADGKVAGATLKLEYKALSGPVRDIAWDGESKRLIAVGDGREKFGSAFLLDGGNSAGTIEGHSKAINAVALNRARPYRAVTAADDNLLGWYAGAPYKLAGTRAAHTRFAQAVAFSPSGAYFASGGSDAKVFLFDGKTGEQLAQINNSGEHAHAGTVYGVEFHPTRDELLATTGADGTVKVWEVASGGSSAKVAHTFDLRTSSKTGTTAVAEEQQVALCWAGPERVVAVSVGGVLSLCSTRDNSVERLAAPSRSISSLAVSSASASPSLYAGSYDGRLYALDAAGVLEASGASLLEKGGVVASRPILDGTAPPVTGVAVHGPSGILVSVGLDDTLRWIEPSSSSSASTTSATVSLSGQPKSLAIADATGTAFVVTSSSAGGALDVVSAGSSSKTSVALPAASNAPGAVAVRAAGDLVAVGSEDAKVRLYAVSANGASASALPGAGGGVLSNGKSAITALAFSPDGALLAAGESTGKIVVYDVSAVTRDGGEAKVKILHWVFHTARVHSIAFSPDGQAAVSGSL